MTRECIICGKSLKTGRKYCWEHRHTAQGERAREHKELNEIEQKYIDWRINTQLKEQIPIFIISMIFFFIIFFFIFKMEEVSIIIALFLAFLVLVILGKKTGRELKKEAKEEIINRDEKYISFAKKHIKEKREEREFKRSLFK